MPDLAILYEHPVWFQPLFDVLGRRGVDCLKLTPAGLAWDPADPMPPAPVILNRVAMSSGSRSADTPIFFTDALLDHWRARADVVNGAPFALDASKAKQMSLLARLGLAIPRTRIVHRRADLAGAGRAVGFPLLVKANIGGAGKGIARYDRVDDLMTAIEEKTTPVSADGVLLVQDLVPARDGRILRIETLGGRLLYGLSILSDGGFDLCPADACVATPGRAAVRMEAFQPDAALVAATEAIAAAARLDLGGIELMIDDRDGTPRFFDVNALSNFVARPLDVLGWDPHERLVDYLVQRIESTRA